MQELVAGKREDSETQLSDKAKKDPGFFVSFCVATNAPHIVRYDDLLPPMLVAEIHLEKELPKLYAWKPCVDCTPDEIKYWHRNTRDILRCVLAIDPYPSTFTFSGRDWGQTAWHITYDHYPYQTYAYSGLYVFHVSHLVRDMPDSRFHRSRLTTNARVAAINKDQTLTPIMRQAFAMQANVSHRMRMRGLTRRQVK
jgi:hypothetical protein